MVLQICQVVVVLLLLLTTTSMTLDKPAIQGLRELWSESFCLLLQKYESERLLDPTGGSPDVVHLIKYVSLVLG